MFIIFKKIRQEAQTLPLLAFFKLPIARELTSLKQFLKHAKNLSLVDEKFLIIVRRCISFSDATHIRQDLQPRTQKTDHGCDRIIKIDWFCREGK